jgi:hypothetical protein
MPITIPYPSGKGRLARFIVSQLPKGGRTYVEPFVGRGNLFWAAIGAELKYDRWWLTDTATIPLFRAIKQAGHTLKVPIRCRVQDVHGLSLGKDCGTYSAPRPSRAEQALRPARL